MAADPRDSIGGAQENSRAGKTPHVKARLHQAVFGYRRGHRLLAGSIALDGESMSRLLAVTDPSGWGVFDARAAGGVAVLPMRTLRSVAILRAWPDVTAGRPGAVISHVVFVSMSDLAATNDPSILLNVPSRPEAAEDLVAFGQPITIDLPTVADELSQRDASADIPNPWPIEWHGAPPQTLEPSKHLLAAVYSLDPSGRAKLPSISPNIWEAIVGQMWAQQWARLRRSFSFTSIPVRTDGPAKKWFDLAPQTDTLSNSEQVPTVYPEWIELAAYDLHIGNSKLREFLRNYGVDEPSPDPFSGFAQLVTIFLRLETAAAESNQAGASSLVRDTLASMRLSEIGTFIAEQYPERSALARLKEDLFRGDGRTLFGSTLLPSASAKLSASLLLGPVDCLFDAGLLVNSYNELWSNRTQREQLTEALTILDGAGRLGDLRTPESLLSMIAASAASTLTTSKLEEVDSPLRKEFLADVLRRRVDLSEEPALWRNGQFANAMVGVLRTHDPDRLAGLPSPQGIIDAAIEGLAKGPSGEWAEFSDHDAGRASAIIGQEIEVRPISSGEVLQQLFGLLGSVAVYRTLDLINNQEAILPRASLLMQALASFSSHTVNWLSQKKRVKPPLLATLALTFDPRDAAWAKVDHRHFNNLLEATSDRFDAIVRGESAAFYIAVTEHELGGAETSRVAWRTLIELADAYQLSDRAWSLWSGQDVSDTSSHANRVSRLLDAYASLALKRGWSEESFREGLPSFQLYETALRLLIAKQKEQGASATITRILNAAAHSDDIAIRAVANLVRPLFVSTTPAKPDKSKKRRR